MVRKAPDAQRGPSMRGARTVRSDPISMHPLSAFASRVRTTTYMARSLRWLLEDRLDEARQWWLARRGLETHEERLDEFGEDLGREARRQVPLTGEQLTSSVWNRPLDLVQPVEVEG